MEDNGMAKGVVGDFKLSEKVISTIVATAASEVAGVRCASDFCGVKDLLSYRLNSCTTKIRVNEGAVIVDLCVKMVPGTDVKKAAQEVQKNVKDAVQNMTGFVVLQVNVTIMGLFTEVAPEKADVVQA